MTPLPASFKNVVSVEWQQIAPYHQFDNIVICRGESLFISYQAGNGNDVRLSTSPPFVLGDVNQDGEVNLLDVGPFVFVLTTGIYQAEADINQDGFVNLLDVAGLVGLISN